MVTSIRKNFNQTFTTERYQRFLEDINSIFDYTPPFRIAETPFFIGEDLKHKLFDACDGIIDQLNRPDFKEITKNSILPEYYVGNEDEHTLFLQMDFGLCEEADGTISPQLIEAQGFPSLYFFQDLLANKYRQHFDIPEGYHSLFNGLNSETYVELLRRNIVGNSQPENVVLLEILPDQQNTRIDFLCTQKELGIAVKCISDLKKSGNSVYYIDEKGRKIGVEKIYNRVIFDELVRYPDLKREFSFADPNDIKWIGHPNWFFRISKFTLPFLDSPYVPPTYFLHEAGNIKDLENYVLKPLYSFAGKGVLINVSQKDIDAIEDPQNYILQKKVTYAPVLETPTGPTKCEIRMLMLWEEKAERAIIINNLVRLSKGEMVGVRYNKDKDWVGASTAFFKQ